MGISLPTGLEAISVGAQTVSEDEAFPFIFVARRKRQKRSVLMSVTAMTPPTTPPIMAGSGLVMVEPVLLLVALLALMVLDPVELELEVVGEDAFEVAFAPKMVCSLGSPQVEGNLALVS